MIYWAGVLQGQFLIRVPGPLFCPLHCLIGSTSPPGGNPRGPETSSTVLSRATTLYAAVKLLPLGPAVEVPHPTNRHQPDAATPTSLFLAAPHVLPQTPSLFFLKSFAAHYYGENKWWGEGRNNRVPTGSAKF